MIDLFIATLNPAVSYALLGFAPHFLFSDLPRTSARHVKEAEAVVWGTGLDNVCISNHHLLSRDYGSPSGWFLCFGIGLTKWPAWGML